MTAVLTGKAEHHLCTSADAVSLGARVPQDVVEPLLSLKRAARTDGFDPHILTGYRRFAQHHSIWTRKASRKPAASSPSASPLDVSALSYRD